VQLRQRSHDSHADGTGGGGGRSHGRGEARHQRGHGAENARGVAAQVELLVAAEQLHGVDARVHGEFDQLRADELGGGAHHGCLRRVGMVIWMNKINK